MKFLFHKSNAVNVEFVTEIFIDRWSPHYVQARLMNNRYKEIYIKEFENFNCAQDYLIDLANSLHFVLYDGDKAAINPARIKHVYIDDKYSDYWVSVMVEVDDDYYSANDLELKRFESGDKGKNVQDAEDYLAELVKILNGGAK